MLIAAPGIQQLVQTVRRLLHVDPSAGETQLQCARGRSGIQPAVRARGQCIVGRQRGRGVAPSLLQQTAGEAKRRIVLALGKQSGRRSGFAARHQRLGHQRQQAIAQRGRIGEDERQGGGEHRGSLRRTVLLLGQTHGAPQRDVVGAGQPFIVQSGSLVGAVRQHGGHAGQRGVVRRLHLMRIIGGRELQQRLRLCAEAQRNHRLRRCPAAWPAAERRRCRVIRELTAEALQQCVGRQCGEVEASGQGVTARQDVRGIRRRREREAGRAAGQHEAILHRPQDNIVADRFDSDALPGRHEQEFHRSPKNRHALTGLTLRSHQQGRAGVRIGQADDPARRGGRHDEATIGGDRTERMQLRLDRCNRDAPDMRSLGQGQDQGLAGLQAETDHGGCRQLLDGRRAEDRIVAQRCQVERQLLVEHDEGDVAAAECRDADRGVETYLQHPIRLPVPMAPA